MTIFRHRHLCCVSLAFSITLIVSMHIPMVAKIVGACLLFAAALCLIILSLSRRKVFLPRCIYCFITICLALILSIISIDRPLNKVREYDDENNHYVSATVTDVIAEYDYYCAYRVSTRYIDGLRSNCSLTIHLHNGERLSIGHTFLCTAIIEGIDDVSLSSDLLANGTYGVMTPQDSIVVQEHRPTLRYYAREVQQSISNFFSVSFHKDTSSFLSAILIGDKTQLQPFLKYRFRRLGLSHILALSGLHVSVLILALSRLLSLMRVRPAISRVILFLFITAYAIITGLSPSILRAGCMSILMIIAESSKREKDSLTSLAFAGFSILLVSPTTVLDLGFWLSVMATLGVILSSRIPIVFPFFKKHKKLYRLFLENPFITLCATLFTMPITLLCFGQLSLFFLPANILFPQLVTWYMYAALVSLLITPLRPLIDLFNTAFFWLLGKIASIPDTMLTIDDPITLLLSLLLFLLVFMLLTSRTKKPKKIKRATLTVALAFVLVISINVMAQIQVKEVVYTSAGNEDDVILVHHEGDTILSITPHSSSDVIYSSKSLLDAYGENDINLLYLPVYSANMVRTIYRLSGDYLIQSILVSTPLTETEKEVYEELKMVCQTMDVPLQTISVFDTYTIKDVTITTGERTPVSPQISPYFAYQIVIDDFSVGYQSSGYSVTPLSATEYIPDIIIYGRFGKNPLGYEYYSYPGAPQAFILSDPATSILLSQEEQELLERTKCSQGGDRHVFPIP